MPFVIENCAQYVIKAVRRDEPTTSGCGAVGGRARRSLLVYKFLGRGMNW